MPLLKAISPLLKSFTVSHPLDYSRSPNACCVIPLGQKKFYDSFLTVWSRAGHYNAQLSAPLTWLTHIVRNRAIDLMRGSDNRLQSLDDDETDSLTDNTLTPLVQLQQDSEAKQLADCLTHLPVEQRQSIMLAYYQGLSHGEISVHLQQPLGTIKSWIRRALDHLKDCVGL